MTIQIIALIFTGFGDTDKQWTEFIDKLKKNKNINKIYIDVAPWNNYKYYNPKYNKNDYYDDIDFIKKDIDVKTHCKNIYMRINKINYKYIVIGHSIGSFFVYIFDQLYHKQCISNILIDGTTLQPWMSKQFINNPVKSDLEFYSTIELYSKKSNKYLQNTIKQIKLNLVNNTFDDNIFIDYQKYVLGHITYKMWIQELKPLKTKTFAFRNIESTADKKYNSCIYMYEKYMLQNNKDKYSVIYFKNKTHKLHKINECIDIIMNTIKTELIIYLTTNLM